MPIDDADYLFRSPIYVCTTTPIARYMSRTILSPCKLADMAHDFLLQIGDGINVIRQLVDVRSQLLVGQTCEVGVQ